MELKKSILNTIIIIFILSTTLFFCINNIIYDVKNHSYAKTIKISAALKNQSKSSDIILYKISIKEKLNKIGLKDNTWILNSYYFKGICIAVPDNLKENLICFNIKIGSKNFIINNDEFFSKSGKPEDNITGNIDDGYSVYKLPDYVYLTGSFTKIFSIIIDWRGFLFIFLYSFLLQFVIVLFGFGITLFYVNIFFTKHIKEKLYAIMAVVFVNLFLLDLRSCYYSDWYNHYWLIGYFCEFIKSNLFPPMTINVNEAILSAEPIFYGYLFYPFIGLLSTVIGPNLALRFMVFFLYFVQYYFCWKLVFKLSKNKIIANIVSIIITWSIYPLTNLYNRSAVTEFAAILLAFISLCLLLLILFDKIEKRKNKYYMYFSLAFVFCIGSHPITALYFTIFLLLTLVVFIPNFIILIKNKKNIIWIFMSMIFIFLSISPWIYAVVFNKDLAISNIQNTYLFPGTIDSFFNRFSLLLQAVDKRVEDVGLKPTSTPYLDTQVNVCIILFIAGILIFNFFYKRNNKKTIRMYISFILAFIFFLLISLMSLSNNMFKFLPKLFAIIQFNYRLTTYINFSIFIILILFFYHFGIKIKNKNIWIIFITSLFFLSLCSVIIKIEHINSIKDKIRNSKVSYAKKLYPDKSIYFNYPARYYAEGEYTNKKIIKDISLQEKSDNIIDNIKFNINNETFNRLNKVSIDLDKKGWIETNISRFIWNKVYIDDKEIDLTLKKGFTKKDNNNILYIYLTEGKHNIIAVCSPPIIYKISRIISIILTAIAVLFFLFYKIIYFILKIKNKKSSIKFIFDK